MKIRCKRYLYTLILKDSDKADKIKQSLPPSKSFRRYFPHSRAWGLGSLEMGESWGSPSRRGGCGLLVFPLPRRGLEGNWRLAPLGTEKRPRRRRERGGENGRSIPSSPREPTSLPWRCLRLPHPSKDWKTGGLCANHEPPKTAMPFQEISKKNKKTKKN